MPVPQQTPTEPLEEFYDRRFESGYMREWPAEKKQRIADIIAASGAGPKGRALDFGCGQGVFTNILQRTLPGWTITGSDLSPVAREMAAKRFPACTFLSAEETAAAGPYDLIFTHHVLEHVDDLPAIVAVLGRMLAPNGRMVHILPCGNAESFEHRLASMRIDGIDPINGRFFLDEEGHLRRLTSKQLAEAFAAIGLVPEQQFFANQFWGALNWMSNLEFDHLKMLFDPTAARNPQTAGQLGSWRRRLMALRLFKRPPAVLFRSKAAEILSRDAWTWRDRAWLVAANPLFGLAFFVRRLLQSLSDREWEQSKRSPGGSEMFVIFGHP